MAVSFEASSQGSSRAGLGIRLGRRGVDRGSSRVDDEPLLQQSALVDVCDGRNKFTDFGLNV